MKKTDSCKGGGEGTGKKSEVTSQRTYMHDPWTRTKVWGLTVGVGGGLGRGGKGRKIGTTVIAKTIQYLTKRERFRWLFSGRVMGRVYLQIFQRKEMMMA